MRYIASDARRAFASRQGLRLPSGQSLPNLWLKDAATHAWLPFWLHDEHAGKLACLANTKAAHARWLRLPREDRAQLEQRGFVALPRLLPAQQISALRRYYRGLIREGLLPFVDAQGERRFVLHDEPMCRLFQRQLMRLMTRLTGQRLEPSLTAVSAYIGGARLATHLDGAGSDWNISLQVDYTPGVRGQCPWPLTFGVPGGRLGSVRLGLGDAVVYRGNVVPHGRPRLPTGHTSTTVVFHYRQKQAP